MDNNKIIEELRDKLNEMIEKDIDPKMILEISQELDIYIVEETKKLMNIKSKK